MTIMSRAVKIRVTMVAAEIIKKDHAERFVPGANAMLRDDRIAAVTAAVQRDRIDITDAKFRDKYADYIRRYWGDQPLRAPTGRERQ